MKNVMIDCETLGKSPSSVIISLAAVKFEFGSDATEVFSINFDPKSSKKYGMTTDQDTIDWWKTQPKEAIQAFMSNQVTIESGMDAFLDFLGPERLQFVYWANGSTFDFPLVDWTLKAIDKPIPWKYWNCRDARTIYSICGINMKTYPRIGQHHNAVDDCLTQIKALKEALA